MKIAVLSGKGGTGKTLVSVNLAAAAGPAMYIDCDVEEPNGHLFFRPQAVESEEISVPIPHIDPSLCSGCRTCVDFCKFNALAYVNKMVQVFGEVCHSCGGCALLCPQGAISERDKIIGRIERGVSDRVTVLTGILKPGEASGIPIIKRLLADAEEKDYTFIDCPPGSACIVMETIMEADYCILVAEPTVFGVHNLAMVHQLVQLFHKPFAAVLNKCVSGENPAQAYCDAQGIEVLAAIPYDEELGLLNSRAKIAVAEADKYRTLFQNLLTKVERRVRPCGNS
ncbi:MAG: 4Fe-4S binding protein [Bacillota bacterium]|jgi:MinD superfamily P-loop ATPase